MANTSVVMFSNMNEMGLRNEKVKLVSLQLLTAGSAHNSLSVSPDEGDHPGTLTIANPPPLLLAPVPLAHVAGVSTRKERKHGIYVDRSA